MRARARPQLTPAALGRPTRRSLATLALLSLATLALLSLATLSGCSAPAKNADLADAHAAARAGDKGAALAAYQRAQRSCDQARSIRVQRHECAQAYLGPGELLEQDGPSAAAARAYEDAEPALIGVPYEDRAAAATALYRAGRLRLALGHDQRGYQHLWRVVTDYPDQVHASDALRVLLGDGRRRDPAALYRALGQLATPLARTGIGDNLLFAMADLAENELDDPRAALTLYDQIAGTHDGGLFDDARWHGARLARQLGDPRGAVERLRALLATREVTIGPGSYFSVWLDNAQLELGMVLRDDLADYAAATRAFLRLPRDYPDSILIDDALWGAAVAQDRADDSARTCALLDRLERDHPESRYQLSDAPALRQKRACQTRPSAKVPPERP